jgi:hypothetical protein
MRLLRARRAAAVVVVASLAVAGAACGEDDPETATSPTTTSPRGSDPEGGGSGSTGPSTTTAPGTESSPRSPTSDAGPTTTATTAPSGPGGGGALTDSQAEDVVEDLMASYRAALASAKASNDEGEALLSSLGAVFTGTASRDQLDGLRKFGGLAVVAADPAPPEVRAASVGESSRACVSGTVRVRIDPMFTKPIPAVQPYSIRLLPAGSGAPAPGWRLDYFSFSSTGAFTEEARCPA